ncbi:Redoxin-domain-containing protein [Morchella snyderi]|nr:Redoxin-domain-containing protein [Morchella snyderi]
MLSIAWEALFLPPPPTSFLLLQPSPLTSSIPSSNQIHQLRSIIMVSVGSTVPAPPKSLWEKSDGNSVSFPDSGTYIIVGVPGAFTPPCSSQVPGYLSNYDKFSAKGVSDIYIVAVNDIFVVNAWKEKLGKDSKVHFVSDCTGEFIKSLGLDFDATGLLGGTRSKRFTAVVKDGKVDGLYVEDEAPNITVTAAEKVLASL